MMHCQDGLTVDQPTYNAVQKGACFPGCYFETSNFHCIFEARFGPTIIMDAPPPTELPQSPEGRLFLTNSSEVLLYRY